ncbi:MAG TPA: energy transducer TonB [Burkholderiaceae bacterium]|jgi:outer membrane biosynthesis protein TonB|nr:energy transducer TonB [Burkholderiaceae bacterium]
MQLSVKTSVTTWIKSDATRRVVKRVAFSFLSLWVHGAVLFFLTMTLFAGKKTAVKDQVNVPPPAIQILLTNPPPETPPEQQQVASTPEDTTPPLISEKSLPLAKPNELTPKDGILDCESLDTKPQRFVVGPSSLDIRPDENLSGQVELHLMIHRDGTVIGVQVAKSTMNEKMTEKIVSSAYTAFFRPGGIGGVPVDCDMKVEISITPPVAPADNSLAPR